MMKIMTLRSFCEGSFFWLIAQNGEEVQISIFFLFLPKSIFNENNFKACPAILWLEN